MTTYEMRILVCCMKEKRTFGYLRKRFKLKEEDTMLEDILTKRLDRYIKLYLARDGLRDNITCEITMEGFLVAKDFCFKCVTAWAPIVVAVVSLIISILAIFF